MRSRIQLGLFSLPLSTKITEKDKNRAWWLDCFNNVLQGRRRGYVDPAEAGKNFRERRRLPGSRPAQATRRCRHEFDHSSKHQDWNDGQLN